MVVVVVVVGGKREDRLRGVEGGDGYRVASRLGSLI